MKRVVLLTAAVSLLVGFGACYFFAIGTMVFHAKTLMNEVYHSHATLHVRCLAKKYSWHFHYSGADGKFGAASLN